MCQFFSEHHLRAEAAAPRRRSDCRRRLQRQGGPPRRPHRRRLLPSPISPDDLALRLDEIREAAIEAGRDPVGIEITVAPSTWRVGCSLDLCLARAFADLGVPRLVVRTHEVESGEVADIERDLVRYRDDIIAKL